jgi:hypothetical protein
MSAISKTSRPLPAPVAALGALCGMLLAVVTGCEQKPACEELGSCGGPLPVGDWLLDASHGSCSESLYRPAEDPRLAKGDQPAARLAPPEEAFYDWCDLLTFKSGDSTLYDSNHVPRYSYNDQTIGAAWVHYDGNGNYAASLTKTGQYIFDFPASCVRGFGAKDDATLGDVCTQVQTYLQAKPTTAKNVQCLPSSLDAAGCVCRFDVAIVSGGSGQYSPTSSNTLIHGLTSSFPFKMPAADFPAYATFCNKGSSLELTGKDGAYLFNQPGLRTLELVPVTIDCTDGAQGPGEDGVDCGLACPTACQ